MKNILQPQFKKYQLIALISVLTVALLITGFIYPGFLKTKGAGDAFLQNSWAGGLSASNAVLSGDATGWNKYFSSSKISDGASIKLSLDSDAWTAGGVNTVGDTNAPSNDMSLSERPQRFDFTGSGSDIIIGWEEGLGTGVSDRSQYVYAQKISSAGERLWGGSSKLGVKLSDSLTEYAQSLVVSGEPDGGALAIWTGYFDSVPAEGCNYECAKNAYIQKVNASGTKMWGADGIKIQEINANSTGKLGIISDGAGGAYIIFTNGSHLMATRVDSSGNEYTTGNWVLGGFIVDNGAGGAKIISDGNGGFIISWEKSSKLYSQRFDSSGAVQSGWGNIGSPIMISNNTSSTFGDEFQMVSDGSGGAVFSWPQQTSPGNNDIFSQRVLFDGGLAWFGGTPVQITTSTESDGSLAINLLDANNILVSWIRNIAGGPPAGNSEIHSQKLQLSDGVIVWVSDIISGSDSNGESNDLSSAADNQGGAYLVWDNKGGYAKGQRINSDGTIASGWSIGGDIIDINHISSSIHPAVKNTSGPNNNATYVFNSKKSTDSQKRVYAQRFSNTVKYQSSGEIVSSIIDNTSTRDWSSLGLGWNSTTPSGTSLSFQTRTATDFPVNNALTGTATASSYCEAGNAGNLPDCPDLPSPSGRPEYVIDGVSSSITSSWSVVAQGQPFSSPEWLEIDLGSTKPIKRVVINSTFEQSSTNNGSPRDYIIQTSTDGISWDDQLTVSGNTNLIQDHTLSSTVNARYFRLLISSGNLDVGLLGKTAGWYTVIISEIEIYSSGDPWSGWSVPITALGSSITSPAGRYIQYKATLSTTDPLVTPELTSFFISSSPLDSSSYPISSLVPDTAVSNPSNSITVTPDTDFLNFANNHIPSFSNLILTKTPPPTSNFQFLDDVTMLGTYSVSLDNNTSPINLSPYSLTIKFVLPGYVTTTDKLKVCQDVNHDGLFSCPNAPDGAFVDDSHNIIDIYSDIATNTTYIEFYTYSLSDFLVGYLNNIPTPPSATTYPTYTPPVEPTTPITNPVTPETPTTPITPTTPTLAGDSLETVQLSPIPEFNPMWGVGYPGGRVNWALEHRKNIYYLYVIYLKRRPSAIEVNWWLQHDNDSNNIKNNILNSEEYKLKN